MAVDFMKENYTNRLVVLKIQCTFIETFHKIHEKTLDRVYEILDELLKINPAPKTENILE